MDWAQIVAKSINFQLVKHMDKSQVEESLSYIIETLSFNSCIFVYRYKLYLSVIYLESRDFKGI